MEHLQNLLQAIPKIEIMDILDILLVAFLIYTLLPVFKSTGTVRIAWVVAAVVVVSWLTELLQLHTLHYILSQLLAAGLLAVVVIFQPELRRMLDHVGQLNPKNFFGFRRPDQEIKLAIGQVVLACANMSKEKVGALIVFARATRLDEYFKSGTMIEAQVSEHLIRNIFFPKAALHDGAMVIRDGRVAAAACVLPLSYRTDISAELGTRHRAALGITELTDAVTVVVSEETGIISFMEGGSLWRNVSTETLEELLTTRLCPVQNDTSGGFIDKLSQLLHKKEKNKGGKDNER